MQLVLLESDNSRHIDALVKIWNAACGKDLAMNSRLAEYNTHPSTGAIQAGQIASIEDELVGFVLASALLNDPLTSSPQVGWIDAIAIAPQFQGRGMGSGLLDWAEAWLYEQGCKRARLGGSLRPFVPGLPTEMGNRAYFKSRGYVEQRSVWDLARDLSNYAARERPNPATLRPARSADTDSLLEFLRREFPGRWRYEFEEFLRAQGDLTDYYVLITNQRIDGFARLTLETSERPIERFYMYRLPHPWGQLGPIGVSKHLRGQGLGRALLDAALSYSQERGVRGCLIDWTDLVDFYGKHGFAPYREHSLLVKELGPR